MRRTVLFAAAAVALFTAPAFAGDLMTGGIPLGSNSNLGVISNTAAGIHNKAQQQVTGVQAGHGAPGYAYGFGGFNSNLGSASNAAVGIGNTAQQQVKAMQFGAPKGMFNSNLGTVSNLAAGIGNKAQQQVLGVQQ